MSQYATTTDLQNLAITPAAAGRFGATAMTAQLQAASSIADGYIGGQFALPLQVNPQGWDMSLTLIVCNIAAKLLYNQFGYGPGQANVDELIERRFTESIDWLIEIRDKKVQPQWISAASATSPADPVGNFVVTDDPIGLTSRGTVDNSGGFPGLTDFDFWN